MRPIHIIHFIFPLGLFLFWFSSVFFMMGVESSLIKFAVVILFLLYFYFGRLLEADNRHIINQLSEDKLSKLGEIMRPSSVNNNRMLRLLRAWYFTISWPHYVINIRGLIRDMKDR